MIASRIIRGISSILPLDPLLKSTGQKLFLPFYHSVYESDPLVHVKHLYSMRSLDQFVADLDVFLEHFEAVDLDFVMGFSNEDKSLKKRVFHLTFDDGLRGVYDLVMPELLKRGIPATFFINSAFIDNKALFYRYKISLILDEISNSESKRIALEKHLEINHRLNKEIMSLGYSDDYILDDIARVIGLDFNSFLKKEKPYLSSDQVRKMIDKGFTIGSHSHNHPRYSDLDLEDQIEQTRRGMDEVQEAFDLDYRAFAFPFSDDGVSRKFFERVDQESILDVSFGTSGMKRDEVSFHHHRVPMEGSDASANSLIKSELLYYLLKSGFGKNMKTRR